MTSLHTISPRTQFCAVIGKPIGHSLSPAIHNAAIAALDLDFVYVAAEVDDVAGALAGVRALSNFRGLSVTIPHKIEVMRYVDEISDVDRTIGAINTVIHEGDKLIGLGTDGPGALKALVDGGVTVDGATVLILGTGGAARAIAFTLATQAHLRELVLLDVNVELLYGLAGDLRAHAPAPVRAETLEPTTLAAAMATADIIIHCTPIGMHPKTDASLVPAELFRAGQVVFDIVYTPLETKLLREAKASGCTTICGIEMFVNQAVLQFERFTGVAAPVAVMRNVVLERLSL